MTKKVLSICMILSLVLSSCSIFKKSNVKVPPGLEDGIYAQIQTSKGDILLELEYKKTPMTVANFVGLAEGKFEVFDSIKFKKPFFDGLKFHRVINPFMIQGGDPKGNGSGDPGYKFYDEFDKTLKHDKPGILSMANSGPGTNGSQFFITHKPTPHLNNKHTVFGKVISGQPVVDQIVQDDLMNKVTIFRVGKAARKFNATKVFNEVYKQKQAEILEKNARMEKLKFKNDIRVENASNYTTEEYKKYFYDLVKQREPDALQTESGLVYVIKKKHKGEHPVKGDEVSLHYTGTHFYGDKFDSSLDRGNPLEFKYLVQSLIQGFNEGVGLTGEQGKIDLYIPYYLAYGANGRLGKYADLVFEIEVLHVTKQP